MCVIKSEWVSEWVSEWENYTNFNKNSEYLYYDEMKVFTCKYYFKNQNIILKNIENRTK